MKFLIFCLLLAVTTHFHLSDSVPIRTKRDLRDDLIRRAQRLLTIASGEIRLLKDEARDIEAKGLEAIEVRLVQFELLLKTATDLNEIAGLEMALQGIEEELQTVLTSAGKDHVSNAELEKLVQTVQELNKKATEQVKRLKAANNTLAASGIEREQIRLINLELDLRSAVKSEEIRRLAELLIEMEESFAELLADISSTRKKRQAFDPIREQIIMRANFVIARANAEIEVLIAANRTANITALQQEEAAIQQLVRELRAATNQSQIRALEARLNEAENRLDNELTRLDVELASTATRNALIARAEALNARAAAAITELRSSGRVQLAAQLQQEENIIAELVRQLRVATSIATVRLLEQRLAQSENRLEQELNAITVTIADPEKDALIKRADEVINKTNVEIKKLKSEGKTLEVALLETEERLVAELVTELKNTNAAAAEVARVKSSLNETLNRIEDEIKQLEAVVTSDPERDALYAREMDLHNRANTLVYKLKSEGKELEAQLVETEHQLADALVDELINATDAAVVKQLKEKLKTVLDAFEQTIETLSRPVNNDLLRATILKKAEALDTKAKEAISKLKSEGNTDLAELEKQEKSIAELIASIKTANETDVLNKLGESITNAESLLNKEIERLSQTPGVVVSEADIEALIKKVEDLAIRAKTAIRALREQQKTLEADGLALEVEGLIVMDVLLRSATVEEASRLAAELVAIEKRVEQQLSQISMRRRKRQAVLQATILKRAEDLFAKANAEITALKASNNTADVTLLQSEEDLVKELVTQLKAAGNKTVLSLLEIEQKLIDAENKLDDELKRLQQETVNLAERDAIIKKAEELNAKAAEEITKLRTEGKTLLATELQNQEEVIAELVRQLKAERQGSKIKQLETKLNDSAKKLEDELSKITHVIADPERDELIMRSEWVTENATATISRLKYSNRTQDAVTITAMQRLVEALVDELKRATNPEEEKHLVENLRENLDELNNTLQGIVYTEPVDTEKEALLKRIEDLKNRTQTQVYRLKSEGKNAEAATFNAELELIDLLKDTLVNSKDADEVKRMKDRLKEKLDKLEGEVKALEDIISDPERDALVKRADELKNRTLAQIEKLNGVGNVTEAEALKSELDVVSQLADTARNAKVVAEIKVAKESLKKALDTLETLVKKIEATPVIDQEKVALLKRADEIKNRTQTEANRLKANNQTALATVLETKLELVTERVAQLQKATTPEDNAKLKSAVKELLDNLEADVKQSETTPLNDPEKDALLKRADNATTAAAASLTSLKTQDRAQEAATIDAEVKLIKELQSELTKAVNATESKRLKDSLTAALDQLDKDLVAAAKPLIDDKERDTAVNATAALRKQATDEIDKLKAANRSALTTEIEKQELLLSQLANQLKNVTKPDEFKTLQQKLNDSTEALKKELQRLDELVKAIDSLATKAKELVTNATALVKNYTNVSADTTELEKQQLLAEQQAKLVQSVTKIDDLKPIELKINETADALDKEVKRLEQLFKDIDALSKKVDDLVAKAKTGIATLTTQNKTAEADAISKEVQSLDELIKNLKKAKTSAEVTAFSDQFSEIEKRVNTQLVTSKLRRKRDLKADLQLIISELLVRADQEIKALQQQNRTEKANQFIELETTIKQLEEKLNQATVQTEIDSLEINITRAGGRLYSALRDMGVRLSAKELRLALIVSGEYLIVRAKSVIETLEAQNRTNTVALIRAEEQQIVDLVAQLRNATLEFDIELLENRLLMAENRLQAELVRAGVGWDYREVKDIILQAAADLINRTNALVEKLKQEGRIQRIELLEQEQRNLADLVSQLNNATTEDQIKELELSLAYLEERVEIELANIGEAVVTSKERQTLIREIEEFAAKVLIEGRKLLAKNSTLEAEGLFREQEALVLLDVAARNAVNPEEFLSIERAFRLIETRVLRLLSELTLTV